MLHLSRQDVDDTHLPEQVKIACLQLPKESTTLGTLAGLQALLDPSLLQLSYFIWKVLAHEKFHFLFLVNSRQ